MHSKPIPPACSILTVCLILTACVSTPKEAPEPEPVAEVPAGFDAAELPMFDGDTGAATTFGALLERAAEADVVAFGELHDNARGHGLQRQVVEALFERFPGSVLALEMLERDEQLLVQDFEAGILDAEDFARETNSTRWAGVDSWERWYQPIIDAALAQDGRVVAANAPRRYVRAARTLGYDALRALGPEQRALFDLPIEPVGDRYRNDFFDLMGGGGHGQPMSEEQIQAIFDSQCIWDATMGASVADAGPAADRKVVLLVGRFHIDHDGGTLGQLRHRAPTARILSVSCVDSSAAEMAEEDRGRAQIVVHVGE